MRASNAIASVMLFNTGSAFVRYAGRLLRMGLIIVVSGFAMVAKALALAG